MVDLDKAYSKIITKFNHSYIGLFKILIAEFLFALATVFVKLVTNNNHNNIPAIEATFFRFSIGFLISGYFLYKSGQSFKPVKPIYVYSRAILNTLSLILFFYSVKFSTITNANMLNMTYPVFIFLISLFFAKNKPSITHFLLVLMSIMGIYFIIKPDINHVNIGDFYGLFSGIVGAGAIISLRFARRYDTSLIILFYLMFIGLVINLILLISVFILPKGIQWLYLILSGLSGFLGQWLLTSGYKFISARYGSIASSIRIVYAGFLGYLFFNDPITLKTLLGAILILISILGISYYINDN